MKTNEISRYAGSIVGNQVATIANDAQDVIEKAIRAFFRREAISSPYDPEREFRLFNHVALDPMSLIAVDAVRASRVTSPEESGEEVKEFSGFISYKANHKDVVRPDGAFGRVLIGPPKANVILRVPPLGIPNALWAVSRVTLPIRAIVCDAHEGLDIWVEFYGNHDCPYYAIMDDVLLAMSALGINGKSYDEQAQWLIPGSMPPDPYNSKSLRRRLLFASDKPKMEGMRASLNLLSGALF
jgi:hypothetical protein